jgi:hypothetical protein
VSTSASSAIYIYFWRFSSCVVLVLFVRRQGFSFTAVCGPCGWSIFASKLIVFLSHRSVRTGLSLPLLFRSGLTADRWLCLPLSVRFSPQVFTAGFSSLSYSRASICFCALNSCHSGCFILPCLDLRAAWLLHGSLFLFYF